MKQIIAPLIMLTAMVLAFGGCSKKTDTYQTEAITDYLNLQPGKYIHYLLDSTLYIEFGQKDTVISYEAKDVVDAPITDALGQDGWRILRYLRPVGSNNENDWEFKQAYFVLPTENKLEVIEDNLRYIKLVSPVVEGNSWHGNVYLPDDPYEQFYGIQNSGIQFWDYTYQNKDAIETINNTDYDSTLTVLQIDEEEYNPDFDFKDYWIEKYAKGVGLIYKEVLLWEHQPATGSNPDYWQGFGIRMSIIDHN